MGIQGVGIRFLQAPSWETLREAGERIGGLPLQFTDITTDRCKAVFIAFEAHSVNLRFRDGELWISDYGQLSPALIDVLHAAACAVGGTPQSTSKMRRSMPATHADVLRSMRETRVISLVVNMALLGILATAFTLLCLVGHLAWRTLS